MMLFKVGQVLRVAFLRHGEVGGREAGDRAAGVIGHHNIEQDLPRRDRERGCLLAAILQSWRGLLRFHGQAERAEGDA